MPYIYDLKTRPLVSVIMPCFNSENTIRQSVETVLHQSYENIEIVIIDDGSTDSTQEIIKSINDPRIVYYRKLNSGVSDSRNQGVRHCSGKYVCFLDSDDFMLSNNIHEKLKIAEQHKIDLITADDLSIDGENCADYFEGIFNNLSNIKKYSENMEFTMSHMDFSSELSDKDTIKLDDFYLISPVCLINNFPRIPPFSTRSIFLTRSLLEKTELFDTTLSSAEDIKLWFKITLACKTKIAIIPETLTVYNLFFSSWKNNPNYSKNDHNFYKSCLSELSFLEKISLAEKYYCSAWLVALTYRPYYLYNAIKNNPKSFKYIQALIKCVLKIALLIFSGSRKYVRMSPKITPN